MLESRDTESEQTQTIMDKYSVWALPPEDVTERLTKLMSCLRSEFGGPEFEPHLTVVGAINLTESDARNKLQTACEGLKAYTASVDRVATGMCVYLLLRPTPEVFCFSKSTSGLEINLKLVCVELYILNLALSVNYICSHLVGNGERLVPNTLIFNGELEEFS